MVKRYNGNQMERTISLILFDCWAWQVLRVVWGAGQGGPVLPSKSVSHFSLLLSWNHLQGEEATERSMSSSRSLSPMKVQSTSPSIALLQEDDQDEKDEKIKQLEDLVNSLKTEIVALKTVNSNPEFKEDEDCE